MPSQIKPTVPRDHEGSGADALLAAWVQRRCEASFRTLVDHFGGLVYGTAVRATGGRTDLAADVAQRVFCDLARLAPTLSPKGSAGLWLHRRARWAAADALKAERRRKRREAVAASDPALPMNRDHEIDDPSEAAIRRGEWAPALDAALAALPKPDRQAIILRFLEGQRLSGVAAELGIGEEAARKRVARALGKLRRLFSKKGIAFTAAGLAAALGAESARAAPAGCAAAWANASLAAAPSGWAVLAPKLVAPIISAAAGIAVGTLLSAAVVRPLAAAFDRLGSPAASASKSQDLSTQSVASDEPPPAASDDGEDAAEPMLGMAAFLDALAALYEQPPSPLRDSRQRRLFARLAPGLGLELGEALLGRIRRNQADAAIRHLYFYWRKSGVAYPDLARFLVERWPAGFYQRSSLIEATRRWAGMDIAAATDWFNAINEEGSLDRAAEPGRLGEARADMIEAIGSGIKDNGRRLQFLVDQLNRGTLEQAPAVAWAAEASASEKVILLLSEIDSKTHRRTCLAELIGRIEFDQPTAGFAALDTIPSEADRSVVAFRIVADLFSGQHTWIKNGRNLLDDCEGGWSSLLNSAYPHLDPTRRDSELPFLLGHWARKRGAEVAAWVASHPDAATPMVLAAIRQGFSQRGDPLSEIDAAALGAIGIQVEPKIDNKR